MKKDKINILYEDKDILVVNKPAHLLSVSTDKEKERTLFHKAFTYIKQKNKNNHIYIVHRLDRETSGIVLFAKSEKIKFYLQDNWDKIVTKRGYIAVVEGKVEKENDTIKSYLKENKELISYSTNDKDGKPAITKYKRLATSKSFTLLDVEILTGRKNQIRVHMTDIGHPVIGDKKYNAKTNPIARLGLHAYVLEMYHPVTKKKIKFEAKIPREFLNMFHETYQKPKEEKIKEEEN